MGECAAAPDGLFHYVDVQKPPVPEVKEGEMTQAEAEPAPAGEQQEETRLVSIKCDDIEPVSLLLTTTNWMENDQIKDSLKEMYEVFKLELPANWNKVKEAKKTKKTNLLIKR